MHWLVQQDLDRAGSGQDNLFHDVSLTFATEGWRRVNFMFPDRPTVSILIDEKDFYLLRIILLLNTHYWKTESAFPIMLINFYHVYFHFNPKLGLMNSEMTRQRKMLVQLIVLFCEAVRFKRLRAKLLEIMEDGRSFTLPQKMWSWLQDWSTTSMFALSCKQREGGGNMQDDPRVLRSVEGLEINSRED
uniref:Uncharacterized protein n=1 Tax=Setaria italica TaxID=4555 RepID=K3YDJ1_SETIT